MISVAAIGAVRFSCVARLGHAFLFDCSDFEGGIHMKNRFRKITAVFLVVVMVAIMIPVATISVNAGSVIESAIAWAIDIANDDSHLYSQSVRWGPSYDCSSFVISAYNAAGVDTGSASWTGNMIDQFTKHGFIWIDWSHIGNVSNLQRGDVLLYHDSNNTSTAHTEIYLGNNMNVGAHSAKRPAADQISVSGYYWHPWHGVLRYAESNPNPPTNATISANKYAYGLDDIIELTFNADGNVEYYGCQVWEDDKLVYGKETTNNRINIPCSELGSGKYAAYVSCVNSYGNTISSIIEFYIAKRLSNPQISINKQKFEINDTIVFNASADGCPDYYGLQVWKGDTVVYHETFTGHSINVPCEKLGVGDYGAFISCVNPSGSIVTDTVSFRIGNELTNPQISINKNSFKISDVIEFSAAADGGVDYYGLQVWKGDTVVYHEEFTGHTIGVSCDSLGCGEFGAFISCVNKLGVIFTDVITFTISSDTANSLNSDNFDILLSSNSYTYDGTAKIPTVTVKNDTATLAKDIDYTVKYSNNINAGTATVTVIGIGNYTDTLTKPFIINKAPQTVNATISSNTIDIGGTSEITASGYGTISYTSSNTNVATVNNSGIVTGINAGTATIAVTATGNNNYNEASQTFTVLVKSAHVLGDVNGDGVISIADATTLQKYLANIVDFDDEQFAVADTNGDGSVSIADATQIQKYLANIIPSLG